MLLEKSVWYIVLPTHIALGQAGHNRSHQYGSKYTLLALIRHCLMGKSMGVKIFPKTGSYEEL